MPSEKIQKSKSWKISCFVVIALFVALSVFFVTFYIKREYCSYNYKFINGECADLVISKKAYLELKTDLERFFLEKKSDNVITDASVYFRDLNRGPVMGINEHSSFSSASLLKLPIVMTVLKMAESRPEILDINLVNEGSINDIAQTFGPDEVIKNNVAYSIRDIIRYALVYSDNTAIKMLNEFIAIESDYENNLQIVFRELGLILPDDLLDRDITTRSYASLFRLLYNASYLNNEYSEMILSYLSESNFRIGLKASVPELVSVSNKFGERFLDTGEKQLHDCGVIYFPENPYLLCVMTQGDDFEKLAGVIREVSEKVYKEVNSRKL